MFDGCSLDRRLLFLEPPQGEVHRIYLPRTRMNKGWEEPRVERRASIVALDDLRYISLYGDCSIVLRLTKNRSLPDMSVEKFIRNPLWATLVGALLAAMVVSFFVFVQSEEAAAQAADEQSPYASVSPLIVGGTAVPNGNYPFMAALLDKRRPGDAFDELFCGGTLIDKDSVLTAAHCLVNPKPDKVQVVVGRTTLNQNRGQLRSVSHRFIHPRYKGN